MSENGEIYTAGKNFTLPPALTAWTNSTSACTEPHTTLHMDPMWLYIKDYDKRCEESHCCNRKHFLLLALSKQHLYHLRPSLALGLAPTRLCTQSHFLQRAWLINATPVSVFSQNNITIPYHNSESGNPEVQIKWIWPENWLTEVLALLLRNIAQSHLSDNMK